MTILSNETKKIYDHPFQVSNAVKSINIHLISIHRDMKDIVLAKDAAEIEKIEAGIHVHEQKVMEAFAIIYQRYLGDKSEVQTLYNSFISWHPIRQKIIVLSKEGQIEKALAVTKNEASAYVKKLHSETSKLSAFAQNKADSFYQESVENASLSYTVLATLLILVVVLSVAIAIFVINTSKKAEKDIKKHMHIIDQNVMMATLDLDGNIFSITNEFSRYLNIAKDAIIEQGYRFFVHEDEMLIVVQSGKVWEGEIQKEVKEKGVIWIDASIHPNYDDNYNIINYTMIAHDIVDKKSLEILSITDKLTGLYNRRHFDEVIKKEIAIAKRQNSELAMAVIDIDYFKKYNDHYGHPAGDKVLALVAQTLGSFMKRPNDYLFRLGGEEFGIVFNSIDQMRSQLFLEKIRAGIEDLQIAHQKSQVSEYITISMGAYFAQASELTSAKEIYHQADEALYKAKLKRNSVVIQNPVMIDSGAEHALS